VSTRAVDFSVTDARDDPLVDVALLEAFDDALAVVDLATDQVRWVSSAWLQYLPDVAAGSRWTDALSRLPELAACWDTLSSTDVTSCAVSFDSASVATLATVSRPLNGRRVVRLQPENPLADNVRQYMQAREYLFSTSRTISVSEMATTLAHEINQPIGTITNMLRGVKARLRKPDLAIDTIENALDRALDQAQFTHSVITRIRDFTQARRPERQMLDLCEVVRESVELLDWLFDTNACHVTLALPSESLSISGDKTMLQQVLINLLRNGVDAMQNVPPAQRRLNVFVSGSTARVQVDISDNGQGLDGKEATLFMPFVTSKADGMGVGLNICRSFVELHQGKLWLTPNELRGCTSHIELPRHDTTSENLQAEVLND